MDKLKTKLNKKGTQSVSNIPGYYKKSSSTSLGRNNEKIAEKYNEPDGER